MKDMIKSDNELRSFLDAVKDTMEAVRSSIKNCAAMRNCTNIAMAVPNVTRWSGNYTMVSNYQKAYEPLKKAAFTADATKKFSMAMDTTDQHAKSIATYNAMLKECNDPTKFLQTKLLSLADGRLCIDRFIERVEKKSIQRGHALEGCTFVPNRIKLDGPLSPDKVFESAVVKIQQGREADLTVEEKAAVRHLLKSNFLAAVEAEAASSQPTAPGSPGLLADVYQAISTANDAANKTESDYVNLKFILASAAEVERIWSMAKYILVQQRKGMSPKLFECLIFLKYNRQFWNKRKVAEAYRKAKDKKSSDRAKKLAEEVEEERKMMDEIVAALGNNLEI